MLLQHLLLLQPLLTTFITTNNIYIFLHSISIKLIRISVQKNKPKPCRNKKRRQSFKQTTISMRVGCLHVFSLLIFNFVFVYYFCVFFLVWWDFVSGGCYYCFFFVFLVFLNIFFLLFSKNCVIRINTNLHIHTNTYICVFI